MIDSEEMDCELLDAGLITKEQFAANQAMRERTASDAAALCWPRPYSGSWRKR